MVRIKENKGRDELRAENGALGNVHIGRMRGEYVIPQCTFEEYRKWYVTRKKSKRREQSRLPRARNLGE